MSSVAMRDTEIRDAAGVAAPPEIQTLGLALTRSALDDPPSAPDPWLPEGQFGRLLDVCEHHRTLAHWPTPSIGELGRFGRTRCECSRVGS